MAFINKITIGERALFCAIIESAVNDYVEMACDLHSRQSRHFKSAEAFLFNDAPIDRTMLRDPVTGKPFPKDKQEKLVGCTLKRTLELLVINGQTLDINYVREGIKKKLRKKMDEKTAERNRHRGS